MKEIIINKSMCIGCGACVGMDDEHFKFGDDGLSEVKEQPTEITENVINAVDSCPVNAITINEEKKVD